MSKFVTVIGARPQFIKAAMVSNLLRRENIEIMIHTGQHYDYNMSELFFDEMHIPKPNYNLGISGGTHAQMTGNMMIAIEDILLKEKPDGILVYGDTNSTLAGALSAAKLHIPIYHIEAGTRTHCDTNPEEINRICTDHISKILFACTKENMKELENEGLKKRSILSGDLMYDAFLKYSKYKTYKEIDFFSLTGDQIDISEGYYYLTCHRAENTHNDSNLLEILKAMSELDNITIYPVHPRNKTRALELHRKYKLEKIKLIEPVGYIESLALLKGCKSVVTDSGGLQREAFFAQKKCVTVLDFPVWPETMVDGRNCIVHPYKDDILNCLEKPQTINNMYMPFGKGNAGEIIVQTITQNI
ncbi:UDP-N-acetylglucosamine 2-epimerase (non-hydrolyzing) [bacterium]|nr:UDP-N-acetylglucosamine 2-epimerase (non-hydrolyzing) [bacterium]